MTLSDITPESLIAEITAAFDGVLREDGTTLHEGEELDCRGSPEELLRARQLDTDTRWQEIPDEWIGEFSSAFWFMNSKGLRYYLPAVMIWHFKERRSDGSMSASADNMQTLLTDGSISWEPGLKLFAMLTEPQRRATARWLYFWFHDWPEDQRGVAIAPLSSSFWGKYLVEQSK